MGYPSTSNKHHSSQTIFRLEGNTFVATAAPEHERAGRLTRDLCWTAATHSYYGTEEHLQSAPLLSGPYLVFHSYTQSALWYCCTAATAQHSRGISWLPSQASCRDIENSPSTGRILDQATAKGLVQIVLIMMTVG